MGVPELLKNKANLFEEKGKQYGHSYLDYGHIAKLLIPNEIKLETVKDWNKLGIYNMMIHKMMRIGKTLFTDNISVDSVQDIQVYSAMLEEIICE